MTKQTKSRGFTIVELLIVIVVIAILAAITIVAYNGIQNRARTSAAQATANTLLKKVESYNAINSQYPMTAGTITGTGTQNGVATTAQSDWYSTTSATATQTTALPTAAPANTNMVWYFPGTTTSNILGGCVFYWSATANAVVGITAGSPTQACTAAANTGNGVAI